MAIYPMDQRNKWRVRIWRKGQRRDRIVTGTKADARQVEAQMLLEPDDPVPQHEVREPEAQGSKAQEQYAPTFLDFCTGDYRLHAENHLKASTWTVRKYQIATLTEHFGGTRLDAIEATHVEDFKRAQLRKGLRQSTINDQLKVLGAILSYARTLGIPCASPKLIRLPVRGKRRALAWTPEEVQRLCGAAAELHPDILPLVVFLANTGCRRGEAMALKWRNVDLDNRRILIEACEEWQPKNGKSREIPINDALLPWLAGDKRRSKEWVFPCPETGGKYAYWPQRKFDEARKRAGLEGGPHTLRHTYATELVRVTKDLLLVARILGHSHQRVTELYAHILPDHLDTARAVSAFQCPVSPATVEASRKWGVSVKTVRETVREPDSHTAAR